MRGVQIAAAAVLAAILAWCLCQEYLFLSSVFPIASIWLGITLFALAIILLICALIPPSGENHSAKIDRRAAAYPEQ